MEGIHGVDVSWLHHSPKDHYAKSNTTSMVADQEEKDLENKPNNEQSKDQTLPQKSNGVHPPQSHSQPHRPHLHRAASDKVDSGPPSPKPVKEKEPKPSPQGRRNSWISNLSSKFSSNSSIPAGVSGTAYPPSARSPPSSPKSDFANAFGAAVSPAAKDFRKTELTPPATPSSSPKTGHTFIQSALRRLSSSTGTSMGKATSSGGVCPRKTMNVDSYRERCEIPNLDLKKLRRVAFCVDVEIAGAAQYAEEEPQGPPAPPLNGEPKFKPLEHELEAKRKKDQKIKKGEGAVLKSPGAVVEEKEKEGSIKLGGEEVKPEPADELNAHQCRELKEPARKKEKKKRSESERKERKERKHQEALANGKIPAELRTDGSCSRLNETSTGAETPPKSQGCPTVDPLRIYRRCCQLRETPVLKRIAEQISSPSACHVTTPGILSVLDLSDNWMQLSDIVTLGDYLAVVPVKKLLLENCGLGDEAVRVILAGVLAAKTPEQAKHNKRLARKANGQNKNATQQLGVIEKISFKNNPKINKEGWRHIALFIYMSRSLKAIDLSMIPFPQVPLTAESVKTHGHPSHLQSPPPTPGPMDMPTLLQKAIAERLGGSRLEELVMAECGLDSGCIGKLVDGVVKCGSTRLGLASNNMTREGLEHVLRYVRSGKCEGLDLGGNDLREHITLLAKALDEKNTMWALSLADCHLSPLSLESLLPALAQLDNFRFIDLSHNRDLFSNRPTALGLIRKFLPQLPVIKRVHLMDVAMKPEHAIALAEVLPECRTLAHLNILENHLLSPLASAKTEAIQEEACALYASLMAAVRVSASLICIDIDVPTQDSSEVVKALAKQVVAYSLRNLERLPLTETSNSAIATMADPYGGEKQLSVPDILLHLVGHVDGFPENHDDDEPAPDDDYIVGGTGVVKALHYCLSRAADGRKDYRDSSPLQSGTGTPKKILQGSEVSKGKAKEMSKNLLESARKIRARLLPALVKEAKAGNDMSYRRLQFLDSTLERMIQRFEDEYPETRLHKPAPATTDEILSDDASASSSLENASPFIRVAPEGPAVKDAISRDPEDDTSGTPLIHAASISCRSSSPSLASRQAQEEGRMHRFGQRIKRDILRPQTLDYAHGTTGTEVEADYLHDLRSKLEAFEGGEIKARIEQLGPEAAYDAFAATVDELSACDQDDPERFEKIKQARDEACALSADPKAQPMQNGQGVTT